MANPNKAFLTGTEQVLNWFDLNAKKPYWSVMDAKNAIIFQFADDDMHESRQALEDNLIAATSAGITATLTLRLHPKKPKDGYFNKNAEAMLTTYFRPVEFETLPYNPNMMYGQQNNNLSNQLAAMESKLNALQMQLAEEDEEEEDEEEDQGILGALMGNPAVKQMLMNVVANLVTPQHTQPNVTNLAGIDPHTTEQEIETDEDSKIDEAIERLKPHDPQLGDDLLKLCSIAENDPKQFTMLLKMLRM
jgi:hypothetical protein